MASPEGIAIPAPADLVALRHQARHLKLFPRRQMLATGAGHYRSRFRGRGMDFDEVRPYQPGDDVRTIDWRVTARTTRPHTKVFREERERPVLIVADLRGAMFFGSHRLKSMVACEIAATLAWAGVQANDRVGAMIFGADSQHDLRSGRSHHNVLRFIHGLRDACAALLEPKEDRISFTRICEDVRRVAVPGTSIVVVSDFADLDRSAEKQLHPLARHCDLTFAEVSDPLEIDLPPPGHYGVSDGQRRGLLDTTAATVRENYQNQRRRHRQLVEAISTRLGASLLRLSTAEDFMPELRRHYGSRSGERGRR